MSKNYNVSIVKKCLTCDGLFSGEDDYCSKVCRDREILRIVADSGTIGPNGSAKGIVYSYCLLGHNDILLEQVTDSDMSYKTSPMGETIALVSALERVPEGWNGTVSSDCLYALNVVFDVWSDKKLDERLKTRKDNLKLGNVERILLKGHPNKKEILSGVSKSGKPTDIFNVICDEACKTLADKLK